MDQKRISVLTRRDFIRQAACATVGTLALTNTIGDLRLMNAAMALTTVSDYKALVCIFLAGGNDANNLIIPTSATEYLNYASLRQNLAIPQANLLGITPLNNDGHSYGLHPSCPGLQTLFNERKLALLFNTGTLVAPITRSQYLNNSVERPPSLFSHSDQTTQWQTSIPDQLSRTGWGGRCADLLAAVQPDAKISLSVSLGGINTFEVGNFVNQYNLTSSGAVSLTSVYGARLQAMKDILGFSYPNMQAQTYASVNSHAIDTSDLLNTAIAPTAAANYFTTAFPNTTLGNQLKMVARLIAARSSLSMKRQIFFCQIGGYDTHAAQITGTNPLTGAHANLLSELSQSMLAMQRAMEQLSLSDSVTQFTASDFGRTLPSNSQGSDHGWGSHHLIVGGAVQGQKTYGTFPVQAINGPDDTSTGRFIPTTAIDQYCAKLATWFGISSTDLPTVFPNLGRFTTSNLNFLG